MPGGRRSKRRRNAEELLQKHIFVENPDERDADDPKPTDAEWKVMEKREEFRVNGTLFRKDDRYVSDCVLSRNSC